MGCQGGHTYLVDLRLSDEGTHHSSLTHPAPLCLLDPRGAGGQSLARAAEAMESGAHICIELSGMSGRSLQHVGVACAAAKIA